MQVVNFAFLVHTPWNSCFNYLGSIKLIFVVDLKLITVMPLDVFVT